ncbi:MAG: hypothetical protein J6M53_01925 [Bacteroidaceae bacterium]|nr:hypothetical protein [Bacteroidaceae bacterium]
MPLNIIPMRFVRQKYTVSPTFPHKLDSFFTKKNNLYFHSSKKQILNKQKYQWGKFFLKASETLHHSTPCAVKQHKTERNKPQTPAKPIKVPAKPIKKAFLNPQKNHPQALKSFPKPSQKLFSGF